ncbi:MAG TPA: DUF4252 domain-containing protein [Cyclobacteriaceae bacterium]
MRIIATALTLFFVSLIPIAGKAQTETTIALNKRFEDALTLYFYKNTLRMLNQTENKEFDELIKDIEKMKFLVIEKTAESFNASDYKKLVSSYKNESYEEIMSSRFEGKNFDVFLNEWNGVTKGMIVLANDSSSLYVLDILGRVEINKVTSLFKTIDSSTEIGKMIKAFSDDNRDRERLRRVEKN